MVFIALLPVSVNPTYLDSVRPKANSLETRRNVQKISEANSNPRCKGIFRHSHPRHQLMGFQATLGDHSQTLLSLFHHPQYLTPHQLPLPTLYSNLLNSLPLTVPSKLETDLTRLTSHHLSRCLPFSQQSCLVLFLPHQLVSPHPTPVPAG